MSPATRYAKSGELHIAYQVLGKGPLDLVYVPGWVSHLELAWEEPTLARFLSRLSSFSRLIMFDKRGTGLSDRVSKDKLPTLEKRMDDLRAVMDAIGSQRAAVFGVSEGGNLCALFAATYPGRTTALMMFGTFAKRIWSPDYPWAPTPEQRLKEYRIVEREWGNLMDLAHYVPSKIGDEVFASRLATYLRRAASPGAAVALLRMKTQVDIRGVLPAIRVPTLVIHRTGDRAWKELLERHHCLVRRANDRDLQALSLHDQGRVMVAKNLVGEGMEIMEEAMIDALAGKLGALATGKIYCNMIDICEKLADYRRASGWDQAARRWCQRVGNESGFPGACRVKRAEIMRIKGAWAEAEDEAQRGCKELSDFPGYAATGLMIIGEIRLRSGDFSGAEKAFEQANELGQNPQPGLALLRLAQGKREKARELARLEFQAANRTFSRLGVESDLAVTNRLLSAKHCAGTEPKAALLLRSG